MRPLWPLPRSPRHARRLVLNAATASLALSLGVVGPLACILHCTIFSARLSASADPSPLARMICLLVGRERQAAPDHAMPKSSIQPPPALYQLARPLNQPALIVLVLVIALLLAVRRCAPQMMIAPPTPPPRSALYSSGQSAGASRQYDGWHHKGISFLRRGSMLLLTAIDAF